MDMFMAVKKKGTEAYRGDRRKKARPLKMGFDEIRRGHGKRIDDSLNALFGTTGFKKEWHSWGGFSIYRSK